MGIKELGNWDGIISWVYNLFVVSGIIKTELGYRVIVNDSWRDGYLDGYFNLNLSLVKIDDLSL